MLPDKRPGLGFGGVAFILVWSGFAVIALSWRFGPYEIVIGGDWGIGYGWPFSWAYHQLGSEVGPVDIWHIDLPVLLVDVAFWLGLMIVGTVGFRYRMRTSSERLIWFLLMTFLILLVGVIVILSSVVLSTLLDGSRITSTLLTTAPTVFLSFLRYS